MRVSKNRVRWGGPETFEWLGEGEIHAIALSDLMPRSYEEGLSFFRVDGDSEACERVAIALAVERQELAKVDYVLLDEAEIAADEVGLRDCDGDTYDDEVNRRHVEAKQPSASRVLKLAKAIRRTERSGRFDDRTIARMIRRAIDEGRLTEGELKPQLKAALHTIS